MKEKFANDFANKFLDTLHEVTYMKTMLEISDETDLDTIDDIVTGHVGSIQHDMLRMWALIEQFRDPPRSQRKIKNKDKK